jgi:hypothetical protein
MIGHHGRRGQVVEPAMAGLHMIQHDSTFVGRKFAGGKTEGNEINRTG